MRCNNIRGNKMTFYDTVKKIGAGSLSIIIPKKYAMKEGINKGDFVKVDIQKQDLPDMVVKNE